MMNCRRGDVVLVFFSDSNSRTSKRQPSLAAEADQLGTDFAQNRSNRSNRWSDDVFLHVLEARCVGDYSVWLRLSDGAAGEVDLGDELEGPVFGPRRDIERFKRFSVECHTLTWDKGADFAPEFLRGRVAVSV